MKSGPIVNIALSLTLVLLVFLSSPLTATTVAGFPQSNTLFPEADRFGPFDGEPRAAEAWHGDELVGFLLLTNDIAPVPAYSGKAINHLVGVDMQGKIRGAYVIEHHEPIMLAGIPEERLHRFAASYEEKHVTDRIRVGSGTREGYVNLDGVSVATVTVIVQNEAIMRSVRKLARAKGIISADATLDQPPARVLMDNYAPSTWEFLTGNGAIRRLHVTRGEVDEAFVGTARLSPSPMTVSCCGAIRSVPYVFGNGTIHSLPKPWRWPSVMVFTWRRGPLNGPFSSCRQVISVSCRA